MHEGNRRRPKARQLRLVITVIVHRPDFFRSGSIANEVNLRTGECLRSEERKNIGGEILSHLRGASGIWLAEIQLPDHLRGLRRIPADIVEPSEENQLPVLNGGVTER